MDHIRYFSVTNILYYVCEQPFRGFFRCYATPVPFSRRGITRVNPRSSGLFVVQVARPSARSGQINSAMFSHKIMQIFAQIHPEPAYDIRPIVICYHGNTVEGFRERAVLDSAGLEKHTDGKNSDGSPQRLSPRPQSVLFWAAGPGEA